MNFKNKRTCTFGTDTEDTKTISATDIKTMIGDAFNENNFICRPNHKSAALDVLDAEYEYHSFFCGNLQADMVLLNTSTSDTTYDKNMYVEDMLYLTYRELINSVLIKRFDLKESDLYIHYGSAVISKVKVKELQGFDLNSITDWRYKVTISFDILTRKLREVPLKVSYNQLNDTYLFDLAVTSDLVKYSKDECDINLNIITQLDGKTITMQMDKDTYINIRKGILVPQRWGGHQAYVISKENMTIDEMLKLIINENISKEYKDYYLYFTNSFTETIFKGESLFIMKPVIKQDTRFGYNLIDDDNLEEIVVQEDRCITSIRYVLLAKVK